MIDVSMHRVTDVVAKSGERFSGVEFQCEGGSRMFIHIPHKQAVAIAKAFKEAQE